MARENAAWLAEKGLLARTVVIKVRYSDFTTVTRSHSQAPGSDAEDIARRAIALLAKTDASVVRQVLDSAGTHPERVTEALSREGLIRPSTTQGHIGDVTRTDIVFDAPTTEGGSGGPVFNKAGAVIAVEYAVLQKFGGNAFGVPIPFAVELLRSPRKRPSR